MEETMGIYVENMGRVYFQLRRVFFDVGKFEFIEDIKSKCVERMV